MKKKLGEIVKQVTDKSVELHSGGLSYCVFTSDLHRIAEAAYALAQQETEQAIAEDPDRYKGFKARIVAMTREQDAQIVEQFAVQAKPQSILELADAIRKGRTPQHGQSER